MEELVRSVCQTEGHTVLLKDNVKCKGSFLVHYLLAKLLSQASTRIVLLGLSDPYQHYNRIARKQGCNLQAWRDKGRFIFLGLGPEVFESAARGWNCNGEESNPLAALYLKVRDAAKSMLLGEEPRDGGDRTCIIIDDVSVLDVVAGGSQDAVLDFVHYCQALTCGKQRCSVVLLTHQDVYEEPSNSYVELELEYLSNTVVSVEPLSTGLAADVHGQLTISHRIGHAPATPVPGLQKFQFRIMENSVDFFLPGQK